MADDGVIRIGTEVDISGIQEGMKEASSAVSESTTEMQSAYERLASATAEYATTTANLRSAISQVVSGQTSYANATASLTPALVENVAAANALKDAKAALVAIETEETAVVRGNMSARMAAGAEMRILEGNITGSTRAAGAFLTMLPGVGEAMQSAFAVFGAVALAGVIVDVGQKLYTAFDIGGARARLAQQEIADLTHETEASNAALALQIDKLQQEQVKLEHKPFNGTKMALDEATESANRLYESLKRVADQEEKALGTIAPSMPQRVTGQASTKDEQTMLSEHVKWLGQAKTTQDQLNESTSYAAVLQSHLNDLQGKQSQANQQTEGIIADYSREIQSTQELIRAQQEEQRTIQGTIALNKEKVVVQKDHDAHGVGVIDNKAATAQLKGMEEQLAQWKQLTNVSKVAEYDYWQQRIDAFTQGATQYDAVQQKMAALAQQGAARASTAIDKFKHEQTTSGSQDEQSKVVETGMRDMNAELAKQADNVLRTGSNWSEYNSAVTKSIEAQAQAAQSVKLANIAAEEASGRITKLGADQQIAAVHAADWAAKIKALNDELARLQALAANSPKDPVTGQLTDGKLAGQIQSTQNQVTQAKGQQQASGIADTANIQQQIAQPYLTAFSQINSGWLQVQDRMMYSTRNLGLEFAKMGQGIATSMMNAGEKMVLQAAEHDLMMLLHHQATNTAKVTSDGVTAAQSDAISSGSALKKLALEVMGLLHHTATNTAKTTTDATSAATSTAVAVAANTMAAQSYAAVAAVAALASTAAIPIIGPAMAPGIAAATYAVGSGLAAMAAFEDGTGYVPRDGVAMLHEGEAVVPAPTMDQLRGSDGSNGALTINHTTNINGHSDKAVIAAIQRNPHEIAGALRKHMRQGGRL